MRIPLLFVVFITCLFLLKQGTAATKSTNEVDNGIKRRSAKDHTLPSYSSNHRSSKTSCPVYQHKLYEVKYRYYSIKFKIQYFFTRLMDYVKEFFSFGKSTTFDMSVPILNQRIRVSSHHSRSEYISEIKHISEIIHLLPPDQKNEAIDIQKKWIADCLVFGNRIIFALKKQSEGWDHLLEWWIARHRHYTDRRMDINSDEAQLRKLFIKQDWTMMKYRIDQLYKRQYKAILDLRATLPKEHSPAFNPLYEYFDTIQPKILYSTQYHILRTLNHTKSELTWQMYQSYTALIEHRVITIVRANLMFEEVESNEHLIVITNRRYQLLIPKIEMLWSGVPKSTLPNILLLKASYWQLFLYAVNYIWTWIIDSLKQCLQKSNDVQKNKLPDITMFF